MTRRHEKHGRSSVLGSLIKFSTFNICLPYDLHMHHDFDIRKEIPLVSITSLTYNHAPFIRQCLDSILQQNTNFPFELIIHDDASTDGTADIVREYANKYPHIISPILQRENQHSKGQTLGQFIWPFVRGVYHARCEGDDFWHNPNKLAIQVDYLERHPDVGLVHSDVDVLNSPTGLQTHRCRHAYRVACGDDDPNISWWILRGTYPIWTCTVCSRTELEIKVIDSDPLVFKQKKFKMGDLPMWFELSRIAKVHCIQESLSTYRVLGESASHTNNCEKQADYFISCRNVREYYIDKYKCPHDVRTSILDHWDRKLLTLAYKHRNLNQAKEAIAIMHKHGIKVNLYDRLLLCGTIPFIGSVLAPGINLLSYYFKRFR